MWCGVVQCRSRYLQVHEAEAALADGVVELGSFAEVAQCRLVVRFHAVAALQVDLINRSNCHYEFVRKVKGQQLSVPSAARSTFPKNALATAFPALAACWK